MEIKVGQVWQDRTVINIRYKVIDVAKNTVQVESYNGKFWMIPGTLRYEAELIEEEVLDDSEYVSDSVILPGPKLPAEVHNDKELDHSKVWDEVRRASRGF